jgi:acyl-CoA thioesterase FadM
MEGWIETCRSVVSPWECDITEHFTIAYYFDRLADAAATTAEAFGLRDHVRLNGRRFDVRFARELRAGASFHILSGPIAIDGDHVQLGHQVVDSTNGEVTAWVQETLRTTTMLSSTEMHLLDWPGPAVEKRPEPTTLEGFVPTGRDRVKPSDLDADGNLALAAFVHRFTTANIQALAAIGGTSSYMQAERRGYSTFELVLNVTTPPRLGVPLLVETGLVHLGNSSIRFVHRMCDPVSRSEFARLGQFGVLLDLDARRPAPLPEVLRSAAARLLVPVEQPGS